ncbi:MAG TPA: ABC transporter ATP-binding protein [Bacteroidota bacterium]|nr:ABC transporter ATP-binding protein [Bacteroidota bacterium]
MANDVVLRTEKLGKRFGHRWAASDINLEVRRGDVFGFLGPNGAGKSTTIRMVLSLIAPSTGSVELFGHSLSKKRELALARVAGIVEKPDFYLYLSAYRNMQIAGQLTLGTNPDKKRILAELEQVGLGDRAFDRVKTFSHGMKQRLGIAQALLCSPELIMLDEPTNGLDPQGMKEVRELIRILTHERGITVFLSSHLLNEVEQVATRMAIINKGTMIIQGSVEDLLKTQAKRVELHVEPLERSLEVIARFLPADSIQTLGQTISLSVDTHQIPQIASALVQEGCSIYSIEPKRSLEEFFLTVTESAIEEGK